MDAVRVYELPCSVMVVMNFLPHAADRVRFGLLHKYDDAYLCPPPPCRCSVTFCYTPIIFAEESAVETYVVTWNSNRSVFSYIEITLN
jgi:hypothetical protein